MSATTQQEQKPQATKRKEQQVDAADFFGKNATTDGSKTTSDFIKKFNQNKVEEIEAAQAEAEEKGTLPVQTNKSPLQLQREMAKDGVEINDGIEDDPGSRQRQDEKKPKGQFVRNLIEEKKKLQGQLDGIKKEGETDKATIKQLQEQLNEITNGEDISKVREKLNKETERISELETKYKGEIDGLQQKLNFRDFQEDPKFIRDFVAPIANEHSAIMEVLKGDSDAIMTFERIKTANDDVYRAKTKEDRESAIERRDTLRNELLNGIEPWKQGQIATPLLKMLKATGNYHNAIANWQKERERILEETKQEGERAQRDHLAKWHGSYKAQGTKVEEESTIPENVQKYMEKEGITFDLSEDERTALLATQQAKGEANIDDTNRLIHQGRVYGKMKAQVEALTKMLKERDDYIDSLKGSSGNKSITGRTEKTEQKPTGAMSFVQAWNKKHGR